jgi:hypothetical protein
VFDAATSTPDATIVENAAAVSKSGLDNNSFILSTLQALYAESADATLSACANLAIGCFTNCLAPLQALPCFQ